MQVQEFSSPLGAAVAAADDLLELLEKKIRRNGSASVVLPGGKTPEAAFMRLSVADFPYWGKVTLSLTDERCVPVIDERSNEGMMRRIFLSKISPQPEYISLLTEPTFGGISLEMLEDRFKTMGNFPEYVLLGMGSDGHFASLFSLEDAALPGFVCSTIAPDGTHRISLTAQALSQADAILLLFTGQEKLKVFDSAKRPTSNLPISRLLRESYEKMNVYYSD